MSGRDFVAEFKAKRAEKDKAAETERLEAEAARLEAEVLAAEAEEAAKAIEEAAAAEEAADAVLMLAPKTPEIPPPAVLQAPTAKAKGAKKQACSQDPNVQEPWALRERLEESCQHRELDAMFHVQMVEDFLSHVMERDETTEDDLISLGSLGGFWFATGEWLHGQPIWKSTESANHIGKPVFCFASERQDLRYKNQPGWYFADHCFVGEKDKNAVKKHNGSEVKIFAWATGSECFPKAVHWPATKYNPCGGISVEPLWEYCQSLLALNAHLRQERDQLTEHLAAGFDDKDDSGKDGGKYERHAKKQQEQQSHGGNLPKLATLVAAIETENWNYVERLVHRYKSSSAILCSLVDDKVWNSHYARDSSSSSWGSSKGGSSKGGKGNKTGNSKGGKDSSTNWKEQKPMTAYA